MRWVMAGGGTGGHIYPALAVAAAAQREMPNLNLLFVGTTRGLEQRLIPQRGYPLLTVSARPFPRRMVSPTFFVSLAVMAYGAVQALWHFRKFRPHVVVGTGGYASVCALLAGKMVGSKLILFEANSIPGRTNRVLAKLADFIATGFPEAVAFFPPRKTQFTGTPVRQEVRVTDRLKARRYLGLDEATPLLLAFGGSQGAKRLNEALWDALPRLLTALPSLQIVHLCGAWWEEEAKHIHAALPAKEQDRYQPFGYREDLPLLLPAADLAISRAGSSSVAELLIAGVPSLFVPYPFAIYDHQRFNALSAVRRGAAQMLLDAELSGERLAATVIELLSDRERLAQMRDAALRIAKPFAAEEIVQRILELLRQK